ncbi:iron chaperone [Thermus oshimai]
MAKKGLTPEEKARLEEEAVLEAIKALPEPDRTLAEALHRLVRLEAPGLAPRLWYGMPAYALGGKVVLFFQPASKFKTRYATLGFTDAARLDEGLLFPVAFGLKGLGPNEEEALRALLKKALPEAPPPPRRSGPRG